MRDPDKQQHDFERLQIHEVSSSAVENISPDFNNARPSSGSPRLTPGTLVDDRYIIIAEIGRGGMGCVYKVEQVSLHKYFALKTLIPEHFSERAYLRFQKEAKAASLLDHPGLVSVHGFGIVDDQPYYVMDLVQGESLSQRLARAGPVALDDALPMFIQIAFALGYAHGEGVVHRDLKPANIMIAEAAPGEQQVKLVDFGIAKLLNEEANSLTKTGEIFGSPLYMSPEQCIGTAVDHRSDIYSLGCVMFEALTGLPPFISDSALATMMKHQSESAPTLKEASLGKQFPADVENVVAKLLQKDPDKRYQSLLSLAADLDRIMTGRNIEISQKPAATKKKEERKPADVRIEIAVAGCVLFLLFGYLGGTAVRKASEANEPVRKGSEAKQPSTAVVPANQGAHAENVQAKSTYYSTINGTTRTFRFPVQPVGTLDWFDSKSIVKHNGQLVNSGGKVDASGSVEITNFAPLRLSLLPHSEYKGLLESFRSDELRSLELPEEASLEESGKESLGAKVILQGAAHIAGLESVNFQHSGDGRTIQYLNQLPNLTMLNVSEARFSEDDILKLRRLNMLHDLRVAGMSPVSKLLASPKLGNALRELDLSSCDLVDDDLSNFARFKQVKSVKMGLNPKITAKGISKMTAAKEIIAIGAENCPLLTFSSYTAFKKFPRLIFLGISTSGWPAADVIAFSKLMAPTKILANKDNVWKQFSSDFKGNSARIPSLQDY